MTRAEFLRKLAALKGRGWRIDKVGDIRCRRGHCPIVAVAKAENIETSDNSAYVEAGAALGMDERLVVRVMCAADWSTTSRDKPMRRALLKALGLASQDERAARERA